MIWCQQARFIELTAYTTDRATLSFANSWDVLCGFLVVEEVAVSPKHHEGLVL